MEEAWKVSLQDRQMSMDLSERHSYLQFTYEYAEESLMPKIKNDTLEKTFLKLCKTDNCSNHTFKWSWVIPSKLCRHLRTWNTGKLQNQKQIFVLQQVFCWTESLQRCHVTLSVHWKLLQSNCIRFWKQEKPTSLELPIFLYRKIVLSLTPLNTMHLSLNSIKLHYTSSHSRRLKTVDRRYSTTFGSV